VNSQVDPQGRDYKLQSRDAVTIVAGTPPAGFHPDTTYPFQKNE
jgi:hypothetical protein